MILLPIKILGAVCKDIKRGSLVRLYNPFETLLHQIFLDGLLINLHTDTDSVRHLK
jgi:hypothetical protein